MALERFNKRRRRRWLEQLKANARGIAIAAGVVLGLYVGAWALVLVWVFV